MKNSKSSIDGFIPRRPGAELGDLHQNEEAASIDRSLHTGVDDVRALVGQPRPGAELTGRSDIAESLRQIDDEPKAGDKKLSRRQRKALKRQNRTQQPKSRIKRIVKWFFILLLVAALGIGGFVAYRAFVASGNVFEGNIFGLIQNEPLKKDENGRSNFVMFSTADNDGDLGHEGANLTDSIIVVSIDQEKKDAYLLSLPRDLWVKYQETCVVGNQGKLNAVYFCASDDGTDEAAGAAAMQAKAGEITGLDIQYYLHVNWTVLIGTVDAIGGIEVTIESQDPRGILDRNLDWSCNYTCFYVKYDQGEVAKLDGQRALALARARNASGGYGLEGGNFDREKNQQKILKALREKAVSAGTLTNVGAVTGLIDALGNNLRTNIQTKEIRTLMALGNDIASESIIPLSLVNEDDFLVTTGSFNEQSIVRPVAGLLDYSEIKSYINKNVNASPITREAAKVVVLNGGRESGVAQTEADRLSDLGFDILLVGNADDAVYQEVEIYQLTDTKPASAASLAQSFGTTVKTTQPPVSVVGEAEFVIILGPRS